MAKMSMLITDSPETQPHSLCDNLAPVLSKLPITPSLA